jgi:hypothetical protein
MEKNFALCATKKNILTRVGRKKILNETKNHNPPCKFNGRSLNYTYLLIYLWYWEVLYLLEKVHMPESHRAAKRVPEWQIEETSRWRLSSYNTYSWPYTIVDGKTLSCAYIIWKCTKDVFNVQGAWYIRTLQTCHRLLCTVSYPCYNLTISIVRSPISATQGHA